MLVPPPAPPASRRKVVSRSPFDVATQVPPTNLKGPYPTNQSPVTDFLGRTEKMNWEQAPTAFLPGLVKPGAKRVTESGVIAQGPLVWSMAAYLQGDVTIEGIGAPVVLKAGDVLPRTSLRTATGFDDRYALFCTTSRIRTEGKDIFSSMLDSFRDAQWCLQDSDGNGTLDLAVALSAGAPVKKAADIEPIPYEMRFGQEIPGDDSHVQFRLNRVGKKVVTLSISISQLGEIMQFDTLRSGRHNVRSFNSIKYEQGKPAQGSILGIEFDVTDANQKENWADIEWRPSPAGRREILPIPWKTRITVSYF